MGWPFTLKCLAATSAPSTRLYTVAFPKRWLRRAPASVWPPTVTDALFAR